MTRSLLKQFKLKRVSVHCPNSLKPLGVDTNTLHLPPNLSIMKLRTSMRISFLLLAKSVETNPSPLAPAIYYFNSAKTTPFGNLSVFRLIEPNYLLGL